MIKTKHFLDCVEADDGPRFWVEAVGLTRDLQQWRSVDQVLTQLGPPRDLDDYETFRGQYHEWASGMEARNFLGSLSTNLNAH